MNTTEGLAPLCRVLRISPCRVAWWLCFTENVKRQAGADYGGAEKMAQKAAKASLWGALGLILRKN